MTKSNFETLLAKSAGFLGVAGLSVLISLPGLSQQAPENTSPSVPSTVKPTNPGAQDAGTTNDGNNLNNLNRTPGNGSNMMQQNDSTGQPGNAPVEGQDRSEQDRNSASPGMNQPGANQPGATTGGDSSQQVEQNQNDGSMMKPTMKQNQRMPQGNSQSSPQSGAQSDMNSGSSMDNTTTQQQPSSGSVRALW